jgi:hypothetical protein
MCNGDGKCMKFCNNAFCNKYHNNNYYRFCKIFECKNECELIPCKNVRHCNSAFPAYYYKEKTNYTTNDVCNECGLFDVTFLNEKRECLICAKLLYMVETKCKHEMCLDCVINIQGKDANCPFCRKVIDQPLYN